MRASLSTGTHSTRSYTEAHKFPATNVCCSVVYVFSAHLFLSLALARISRATSVLPITLLTTGPHATARLRVAWGPVFCSREEEK